MKRIILLSVISVFLGCSKTIEIKPKNNSNQVSDVNQGVSIPTNLSYYYQGIDFNQSGQSLYESLAVLTIAKHSNILTYNQRHPYLQKADASLTEKSKIILVYSGEEREISQRNVTFNTEHIYPQSLLNAGTNSHGIGDLHHLRYCDSDDNAKRGNRAFTDGKGKAGVVGNHWFPGDDWRGDVARMLFYINLRYNETFDKVSTGGVSLLLKWNAQDPVSEFEKQRNNEIQNAQKNRNPFIDNPYLATKIWGGEAAENLWK